MNDDGDTTVNLEGLDKLLKAVKREPPMIAVGVLGPSPRSDGKSNAAIGGYHESGAPSVGLPRRSWLAEPLADHLPAALEANGEFTPGDAAEVMKTGSMMPWARRIADLAEKIVLGAFDTSGYGKWPALKPRTLRRKRTTQILVETGQLRAAVGSDIKEP